MSVPPPPSSSNTGKKAHGPPGLMGGPPRPPKLLPGLRAPKLPPGPPSAASGGSRPGLSSDGPSAAEAKDAARKAAQGKTPPGRAPPAKPTPAKPTPAKGAPAKTIPAKAEEAQAAPQVESASESDGSEQQLSPKLNDSHEEAAACSDTPSRSGSSGPSPSSPLRTSADADVTSPTSRPSSGDAKEERQETEGDRENTGAAVAGQEGSTKGHPKEGPPRAGSSEANGTLSRSVATEDGYTQGDKSNLLRAQTGASHAPHKAPSGELMTLHEQQPQNLGGSSSQGPLAPSALQQTWGESQGSNSADPYSPFIQQIFLRGWIGPESSGAASEMSGAAGGPSPQYTVTAGPLTCSYCSCIGVSSEGSIPGRSCFSAVCPSICLHGVPGYLPQQQQQHTVRPIDGGPLGWTVAHHPGNLPHSPTLAQLQQEMQQQQLGQPPTTMNLHFDLIPEDAPESDESEESDLEGLDHRWGMVYSDPRWAKVPYEQRFHPPPPLVSPRYTSIMGGSRLGISGPSYRSLYKRPRRYKMGNTYCKHYQLPTVSSLLRAGMPEFLRKRPIKIMREGSCRFLQANACVPIEIHKCTGQGDSVTLTAVEPAANATGTAQANAGEKQEGSHQIQDNLSAPPVTQQPPQPQDPQSMHIGPWQTPTFEQGGAKLLACASPHFPLFAATPSYPVYFMGGAQQAGATYAHIGATGVLAPCGVPSCGQQGYPMLWGTHASSSPSPSANENT